MLSGPYSPCCASISQSHCFCTVIYIPSVADTDAVVHVAQNEFQELVRQDTACIRKTEQAVIREDSP